MPPRPLQPPLYPPLARLTRLLSLSPSHPPPHWRSWLPLPSPLPVLSPPPISPTLRPPLHPRLPSLHPLARSQSCRVHPSVHWRMHGKQAAERVWDDVCFVLSGSLLSATVCSVFILARSLSSSSTSVGSHATYLRHTRHRLCVCCAADMAAALCCVSCAVGGLV